MRRPRGSPRHLLTYYYFPTGAPGTIDNGNKQIDFLTDTGATYSVLNTKQTKKNLAVVWVTGVTTQLKK